MYVYIIFKMWLIFMFTLEFYCTLFTKEIKVNEKALLLAKNTHHFALLRVPIIPRHYIIESKKN